MTVGKNDVFERQYMARFQNFASQFGEFVKYERDRGARDIGMHLTRKGKDGNEILTSAFCWFQMKGVKSKTLPIEKYNESSHIKIQIRTDHLKFWFRQAMPTYLVIYIESADLFLVQNINSYIQDNWGNSVFHLSQERANISIPTTSILDEHAFDIILRKSNIEEWSKILIQSKDDVKILIRDYNLIYNIGLANKRDIQYMMTIHDWISKARSEINILYKPTKDNNWQNLREHWQSMLSIEDLEKSYPYLSFSEISDDFDEDDNCNIEHTFSSGNRVIGVNYSSEYFLFKMKIELNQLGLQLMEWIKILSDAKIIEIHLDKREVISIAPWNKREV